MKQTRRQFIQVSAAAGAGLLFGAKMSRTAQSPALKKFIQPLPGLGPGGIPVAAADTTTYPGSDFYRLVMAEYTQQLHPDLPKATRLWGYADATTGVHRHLGPVIVAKRGRPVRILAENNLPSAHILPVDTSIGGAELAQNRAIIHLHGGFVPWISDGGPFAWFDPHGARGESFVPVPDMPAPGAGFQTFFYPNDQSARLEWYHDHAMGITRLNAYAGLASAYLLQDDVEAGMVASGMIPERQIPLVVQDKIFKTEFDPGESGDLFYPSAYEPDPTLVVPVPSCNPEFFGDTMLVNGVVFPTVTLEPRRYRLRILNACNARFLNLRIVHAKGSKFPANTEPDLNWAAPYMRQIGTEGGFIPESIATAGGVIVGYDTSTALLMGPGERADVIVDFRGATVGQHFLLYSEAPAPYPSGDPANDYFPSTSAGEGYGPNTRTLLQIKIGPRVGLPDPPSPKLVLPPMDPPPIIKPGSQRIPRGVRVRDLTLNEDVDSFGRLIQMLGTTVKLTPGSSGYGRAYEDAATETPAAGSVEVWRIFNTTGDTHPIHFHLVNVQVVSRQAFDLDQFNQTGETCLLNPSWGPDPNEYGWKETVRMEPGECTTVIMRFELPKTPFEIPVSPRTGGHEYVWHCHILEHEEHDMMRPLIVR